MKRFIKDGSGNLFDAAHVAKLSHSGGTITVTVDWDADGDAAVETFTYSGDADAMERLCFEINYSKEVIIDAANV
jgi:hypothetical protein